MYDITKDYDKVYYGEQPYFTDMLYNVRLYFNTAGLDSPTVDWNSWDNLKLHKDRLIKRFNSEYQFREIGAETVTRWQKQVNNTFDAIAPFFDHAYKLYSDPLINLDEMGIGYTDTENHDVSITANSTSGSGTTTTSKFKDTPTNKNTVINNPTSENLDNTQTDNVSDSTNRNSGTSSVTRVQHDEHTIKEVSMIIDKYRKLDEEFIHEFNKHFIGIISMED